MLRTLIAVLIALALAGCASGPSDGSLTGLFLSKEAREARIEARKAADDAKCQEYGFKPGSDAFANCRLQLDQMRASERATAARRQPRQNTAPPARGPHPTSTTYIDATSGRMVHCSGMSGMTQTCF